MEIKKALTFRASSVGDCLMGKYLLENIHAQFPRARLGLVVGSRANMIREMFTAYPWLEIIEANRKTPLSLWRLWKEWRGCDLVVTQYAGKPGGRFSLGSKFMARLLARRGSMIGFTDASNMNWLYDKLISFSPDMAPAALERKALAAAKIKVSILTPRMEVSGESRMEKPYVLVHLFAGNKGRGLSPEKKRELLQALEKLEVPLVLSGNANDRKELITVAQGLKIKNIAGETTLQELITIINGSKFVVSVDTGVAHIAAQLQKPLIVLATCLGLHWWGKEQYGDAPISVFSKPEPHGHIFKDYPACINEIDLQEVARATLVFGK